MGINIWAILVCAVLSMVIGSIWYGPLFGKLWMHINGVTHIDAHKRKEMQKKMAPLYVVQFVLALFQIYILAHLTGFNAMSGIISGVLVWAGFVLPTTAGACMWNNESKKTAWSRFLVQVGYQLVCFVVFGAILGMWH